MDDVTAKWAMDWGIPAAAIADYRNRLTIISQQCATCDPREPANSEARVQSEVRLHAPHVGSILWRNNVGAIRDERGIPVRFGLANDNAQINKVVKSSDLIGITRVLITPQMVGKTIGQFTARECKKRNWKPGEDKVREGAQYRFCEIVASYGGDARIVSTV